jgi:fatty acid desaturase
MSSTSGRPAFDDPALVARINRLRRPDNRTNLAYLAFEYACLALVIGGAIGFAEGRASWGLPWAWDVPVFALAIALVGAIQHRLAGLGHEASHYTLLRNKFANDLVADVFCMIPILTSIHLYRLFHLAHHQYTNDPARDPDLVNMGDSKGLRDLPMPRLRFVLLYYFRLLAAPGPFLRYMGDYLYVNTLGKGNNVYMRRVPDGDAADPLPRVGTVLGLAYLAGFAGLAWWLGASGRPGWLAPAGLAGAALAVAGAAAVPGRWLFRSPFRQPYSVRFASAVRLVESVAIIAAVAGAGATLGPRWLLYFGLLWLVPLGTSFLAYMLLRDVYQHANADAGRLTNSRVFYPDPFTRWAVFIYGQDVHVTHHLFPAVPHYRLGELHRLLRAEHAEYAATVVECHGTLANGRGTPTLLDLMAGGEPGGSRAPRRAREPLAGQATPQA